MWEDFFIQLGRVYPQIWAALINVVGLILVGFFVNCKIAKLTAKYNLILARQTPTFELQIQETREFIKLNFSYVQEYFEAFYYLPFNFLVHISFYKIDDSRILELEKDYVFKKLSDYFDENKDEFTGKYIQHQYQKTNRLVYSIYTSMIPDRVTFANSLSRYIFYDFNRNTPFVTSEIRQISESLIKTINTNISSKEFTEILEEIKDPNLSEYDCYLIIQNFWIKQQNTFSLIMSEMQMKFEEIWINPSDKKYL